MPVYDAEKWVSEAVESVFAQTFTDFEVVVVDDGSTDGSTEILRAWARREPRLRLVRTDHRGPDRARERLLQEAKGRLAAFLDSDDKWLPQRLERQLPHAGDRTVVFSDAYIIDEAGSIVGTYGESAVPTPPVEWPAEGLFVELVQRGSFIPMLTVMAPVALLEAGGSFMRAGSSGACDFEMWLSLALQGVSFHYLDEPLALYRSRRGQISRDTVRNASEAIRIYNALEAEAAGEERRVLRQERRRRRTWLEVTHRKSAWARLRDRDRAAARTELMASLRVRPVSMRAWLALFVFYALPPLARMLAIRGSADGGHARL
jgi:teichuronic acid biosynthesis glycosyltransferase TuaG